MNKFIFAFCFLFLSVCTNISLDMLCFWSFIWSLCQAISLGWSRRKYNWCCFQNRNFCVQSRNLFCLLERDKILKFLHSVSIWVLEIFLIFQNFLSYRSIRNFQITTDCFFWNRFCFLCIVCLFWWFYGLFRGGISHTKVGI